MTRQWEMFAQHRPDLIEKTGREFLNPGSERYVRHHGTRYPIVPVVLTEDPDGDYYGWIDAKDPDRGPYMIQPHWGMFTMQFPYGPKVEAERGRGEVVRMRVELAEDDQTPVCGESYDHRLRLIDERDGISTYECQECGAEIVEEEEA